jgi:hypothetical protein
MERPWCGRPVVPMSPQARGAECPLCQPVPGPVVRNARQLQASPVRRRAPGSAGCAERGPCGDEHQAAPVVPNESRAEGRSGARLYHSIEAPAQPARAVDAAARRAGSSVFETWYQLRAFPDRMRRRNSRAGRWAALSVDYSLATQ